MDLQPLAIGGIQIAVAVLVTVQGLKVFKFVKTDEGIAQAAVGSGLFFGLGAAAIQIFPAAAPFIELAFVTYVGAMLSGLGYKAVASLVAKFGVDLSMDKILEE